MKTKILVCVNTFILIFFYTQMSLAATKEGKQRIVSDACFQGADRLPMSATVSDPNKPGVHKVLVGVYRPYLDHCRNSVLLEPVYCSDANAGPDCVEKHGTYRRDVYLFADPEFDDNTGAVNSIRLVSDGQFDINLSPDASNPALFTYKLDGIDGTVEIGGRCPEPRCFELKGLTPDFEKKYRLKNGLYQQTYSLPEQRLDQNWSSAFDSKPDNFTKATRCYDITSIDPNRLEATSFLSDKGRECTGWFVSPENDSKRYIWASKGAHNVAVPFGWKFVDRQTSWGGKRTKLLETEKEINDHQLNSTGWNTGINLVIFDTSVHHNKSVEKRTKELYENNTTHSEWETVRPQYALVLDRQNLRLSGEFKNAVAKLLERFGQSKNEKDVAVRNQPLADFVSDWGSHIPYSTTFGATGSQTLSMEGSEIESLAEQGVSLSTGMSAGFSMPLEEFGLPGSAGMNVGLQSADVKDHAKRMKKVLGDEATAYHCIGGTTCNQGEPSADKNEPIYLDLMPVSDLLGPPMFIFSYPTQPPKATRKQFSRYSTEDFLELRSALREYIADVAFDTDRSPRADLAHEYLRVKNFEVVAARCEIATDTYFRNWKPYQGTCSLKEPKVILQNTSGKTYPIEEKFTVAVGALKEGQRKIINGRARDLIMVSLRGKLDVSAGNQCAEITGQQSADAQGNENIKYTGLTMNQAMEIPLQATYYKKGKRTCAVRVFLKANYDIGGAASMLDAN